MRYFKFSISSVQLVVFVIVLTPINFYAKRVCGETGLRNFWEYWKYMHKNEIKVQVKRNKIDK